MMDIGQQGNVCRPVQHSVVARGSAHWEKTLLMQKTKEASQFLMGY